MELSLLLIIIGIVLAILVHYALGIVCILIGLAVPADERPSHVGGQGGPNGGSGRDEQAPV